MSNVLPISFDGWTDLTIDYSGTAPSYEISQCGGPVIVPSTPYAGVVSLSGINAVTYDCLSVEVFLTDSSTEVDNVTVSWLPK
jgi:hypothetical protein